MGSCLAKGGKQAVPPSGAAAVEQLRRRLTVNGQAPDPAANSSQSTPEAKKAEGTNVLDLLPLPPAPSASCASSSGSRSRRASACGLASECQQAGFENKCARHEGDAMVNFGVGHVCKKGLKPESPNQDDFCVFVSGDSLLCGVFDGHGPYGHDVSGFVQEMLPLQFLQAARAQSEGDVDAAKALFDAFPETHRLCLEAQSAGRFDCTLSGTTATMTSLQGGILHVAHVGDSRAVLAKKSDSSQGAAPGTFVWEDLTNDHKPTVEAERDRIIAAGGQVLRLEGDIPHRVFLQGKLYPGLAMTRSIGDTVGSTAGISCLAEVSQLTRQPDWQFILICSDGVWEFVTSEEAVGIVGRFPASKAQEAAEALATEAWGRWVHEEGNVVDDITVVVCWFQEEQVSP